MPRRLVIRELAIADGTAAQLQLDVAVVIEDGHIVWLGPNEEADATAASEIVDGGGARLIPVWLTRTAT